MSTSNTIRINIERKIVKAVVTSILQKGYSIGISSDGENLLDESKDSKEIYDILFDVDVAHVILIKGGFSHGWVLFVYGNDPGTDVICDYTTNIEGLGVLDKANKIIEKLETLAV